MQNMPERIGGFEVLGELGRGGMGVVYKVRDPDTGRLAALKMLPPEALSRPDSALRFKREFRAMKRVQHPNVIRVHEAGTHDGCPFFTMEIVIGQDVRIWLDDGPPIVPHLGPPPPGKLSEEQRKRLNDPIRVRRLADVVNQVGLALGAIHQDRIVHRDLKPDNILVSHAGVVKLMDFGIAKQLQGHSEQSSGGMVVGTFKYLSPEQALGAEVDGRADLYCLGIILFELLAGRHPFYSENSVGYAYHHARKPPPDIERFNPAVHQGLKTICEKLIRKDANERYATAEDVIAAIHDAMESSAASPKSKSKSKGKSKGKSKPENLKPANVFSPGLIGRGAPLRVLSGAIQDIANHRCSVVAIGGSPLFGKSRLLKELGPVGREHGVEVHIGEARNEGRPYAPYVDILDRIVDDLAQANQDDLKKLLGREAPILGRYLSSIERLGTGARSLAAEKLDPVEERLRFMKAVEAFFSRLALIRPRVFCIDNLHLADELTFELTRHLAKHLVPRALSEGKGASKDKKLRRGAPISLVVTIDSSFKENKDARRCIEKLKKIGNFQSFELKALTPVEVKEMMVTMIGGGDVAGPVGDALHKETKGIPGNVEELIRGWARNGELSKQGREWVLARRPTHPQTVVAEREGETLSIVDAEAEDHSSSVVELKAATMADIPIPDFEERPEEQLVGQLSPLAKDVGERCAVAASRLSQILVERVALREEDELLDATSELLAKGVFNESDDGELRFSLKARAALLRDLSKERKQELHQIAARALEKDAQRRRTKVDLERLARHHLEGGEPAQALGRLMQAARAALEASARRSAAELVQKAQDLFQSELHHESNLDIVRLSADLVLLRVDVLAAIGEHRECVALLKRRLKDLAPHLGPTRRGELLLRLSENEHTLGDLDSSLEHVREVLGLTERGGSRALRCQAKSLCGQIYAHRGEFSLSDRYFNEALELARTVGDMHEAERATAALARRRLETGDLSYARKAFLALADDAKKLGKQMAYCRYLTVHGIIALELGRPDEAEKALKHVVKLTKSTGDRRAIGYAMLHLSSVYFSQGKPQPADKLLNKGDRIFEEINDVSAQSQLRLVQCRAALENQDAVKAEALATDAFNLAERAGSAMNLAEASICEGFSLALKGQDGAEPIERGLTAARELESLRLILLGLRARAVLRKSLGDDDGARTDLQEGLRKAKACGAKLQTAELQKTLTTLKL
ncbi:MAG: protein kinase [Deltaproteobacteria bacterium]|nr:protein kinase [Deltaproteobacteria bacterium]